MALGISFDGDEDDTPAAPKRFVLGEDNRPEPRLAGLERMNDRLAKLLRAALEPLSNQRVSVAPAPLATLRFGAWRDAQPGFTGLALYRLRPLKGMMLVALEPAFVAAMVDAFYGGSGIVPAPKGPEFSASEERLVDRLGELVIRTLTEAFDEVLPLTPEPAGREAQTAYCTIVRAEDQVVVQAFEVQCGQIRPTTIQIVYPMAMLRPIEADLAHKVHTDVAEAEDGSWRRRLAEALEDVRLPVRSVLARPEISVAQLLALKVGDVIPIAISPTVPLIAGTKQLAVGMIGEQEGRAALQIQTVGVPEGKVK
ncbi:MAG: FliM/FliN family flagellar motor switch protein [Sphingomonas fennica]